ncbi:GIY-YIG nuclease family protein [Saccharicrinis sp. 156]|uniref:GIY-YIG nuclease family protein n=1 Tax=Saccharicrinis sp. 156 TaxID=3417574 RepID=UPI003D32EA81
MKYCTYILHSQKFDKYYYGQTEDLSSRLLKHNGGKVISTRRYAPWVLFAYKEFSTRSEATRTERKLKNLKSRQRVAQFIRSNDFVRI